MKLFFLKEGSYELNVAIDAMGAVSEVYQDKFFQFSKLSSPFKLSRLGDSLVISDIRQTIGSPGNGIQLDQIAEYLEDHDVVFYGKLAAQNEFQTNTSIVDSSHFYAYDKSQDLFVKLADGTTHTEKNLFSLIYFFKLSRVHTYAMILNSLVSLDIFGAGAVQTQPLKGNVQLIVSEDGNSIRSKLVNLTFSPNLMAINEDRTANSFMLHLTAGNEGSIKLFSGNPYFKIDDTFLDGFEIRIQSNLESKRNKDEITFRTERKQFGYLKVYLTPSNIYRTMTEGNVFERLDFTFYVFSA